MNRRLTPIKEWSHVTAQTLQEDIIPLYQPAVLKNVVKDWEVLEKVQASPLELMSYRDAAQKNTPLVEIFVGDKMNEGYYNYGDNFDEYNFKKVSTAFENILRFLADAQSGTTLEHAYAGAINLRQQLPLFEQRNSLGLLPENSDVVSNVWLGNPAKISTHYDVQDNIACVVSGKREFTLFPPEQIANLYTGPIDKTVAGPPISLVNVQSPDFDKYPKFSEALDAAEVALLEPGDALYIPSLWWHNVRSEGDFCMLVNYWWNNPTFRKDNTVMSLIHGLYSISHLPHAERKAWKSFFDYYVFQLEGKPLEHIPDDERGVLGTMDHEQYDFIRDYLVQNLGVHQ